MWNKILTDALTFGKKFSLLPTIGKIATMAALIYLTVVIATCATPSTPDGTVEVTVKQTTEYANQLEQRLKYLQDTVSQKESTITELKIRISSQKTRREKVNYRVATLDSAATIERVGLSTPLTDTLISTLKGQVASADSIIELQDSVIVVREQQIDLLKNSVVLANTRGDTLQSTLNTVLKEYNKKDKLFGKIPMPSRKTVAAVAFIGGTYLGVSAMR